MNSFLSAVLIQRWVVVAMAVLFGIFGVRAWLQLPIDAFPDISPTQVKIILKAPGMTPEEVERMVTRPLEIAIQGIPNQRLLRSTIKYAITDITIDFVDGTDVDWARQQVINRLSEVRPELPVGLLGGVAPMSTPLSDVFMFTIESPTLDIRERRKLLERVIRPALRVVPGVADVNVLGGDAVVLNIQPDNSMLQSAGLTFEDLVQQVEQQNLNQGVGRLDLGTEAITVRVQGQLTSPEILSQVTIRNAAGESFRLADLARIQFDRQERYGAVTRDGKAEAVEGLVMALRGANTGDLIEAVQQKIAEIQPSLPADVKVNVFYNRQNLIDTAVGTVEEALALAIIFVIVVLVLFLGNLRAALLVAINLPLAALCTFLLMRLTGMTANLMSLGGLVIAIGMLVDSSVVVVENTLARLAGQKPLPKLHIILQAVKEVSVPVISGTLIVVIVFLPLLTLDGLEGKLFIPVALTIVFALLSSLMLSLTLLPALAGWLLKSESEHHPHWYATLQRFYDRQLGKVLSNWRTFIVSISLIFIVSIFTFTQLGRTFMPTLDEGDIMLQIEKIPSISLAESIELDKKIEAELLRQIPEIIQIVARTGSDEIGMDPMGLNETDLFMQLKSQNDWRFGSKNELEADIRRVIAQFPGVNFGFTQPIDMRVSEMLTGARGDVAIKIFGADLAVLAELAQQTAAIVSAEQGAIDTQTAVTEGSKLINISLHPQAMALYAIDSALLANRVRSSLEGISAGYIMDGEWPVPLLIRQRHDVTAQTLGQMPVLLDGHNLASLSDIAVIERSDGPVVISREGGSRYALVRTNVEGRDLVGFVSSVKERINVSLQLPQGYRLVYGGQFENQQRAAGRLLLVVPISLALIFFILLGTFRDSKKAVLVLTNIPFALTGGIFGLFITGEYLSVPASVGFIALMGVAVLNGVVMISHYEDLHAAGMPLQRLVREGAERRLRPILMTASTALLGLLPLLFVSGPGSELQKPLAIVVISGLFTATIVTLFLMPGAYQWLMRKQIK
jgi:cobalt-zinc-cadmium resistance protein CzcA